MSARIMPFPRDLLWPLPRDIKTSLLCWGGYLVALSCYCMLYQVVVERVPPDVPGTIAHACRNWGVWLLTTPVVFGVFRKYAATRSARVMRIMGFAMAVLLVSVAVPVAIDLLTQARDATSSLMLFLPRYVAVMCIVYLIWHVFLRERMAVESATVAPPLLLRREHEHVYEPEPAPQPMPVPAPLATLLVSKGSGQCLIQVSRIECVSAAGNYVEIMERGQGYLMRATLKQLEEMLPAADFIRIHRSHLVKRDEIDHIKTQPSGNGVVQLRGGRVLPMSKKHKQELQRYRVPD